jgi:hypothetical protein
MPGQLRFIARTTLCLGLASLAASGHAADADTLCTPRLIVDKEKLATFMLRHYPVSTAYLSIGAHHAPLQSNRALLHWLLAKRAAAHGAGACDGADACNVDHIAQDINDMLDGKNQQLTPTRKTDALHYFDIPNDSFPVHCAAPGATPDLSAAGVAGVAGPTGVAAAAATTGAVVAAGATTADMSAAPADSGARNPGAAANAAPAPAAQAQPTWLDKVRVRGNPDQLAIDKSDTAGYASVDKAKIDLSNDSVASTRTNDVQAYLGYSLLQSTFGDGNTYEAVPYVGFKQNRVIVINPDGSMAVTTSRTSDVGLLNSFHFIHAGTTDTEDLNVRPDYLMDSENGARLLSANFTYTVFRKGLLNDLIPTRFGVSIKPILIGESRNGTYIDRGDASVSAIHQDFLRLGARVGFAVVSNNPAIPVDFQLTYTGLHAIVGSQGIHYTKAGLTYNFNQNVGLALDYSNGLLPETGDREKKWSLGVASKF